MFFFHEYVILSQGHINIAFPNIHRTVLPFFYLFLKKILA